MMRYVFIFLLVLSGCSTYRSVYDAESDCTHVFRVSGQDELKTCHGEVKYYNCTPFE